MSAWFLWSLLALAGVVAGQAAETIPGTELEPAELVADLPWAFEITIEASSEPEGDSKPVQVTRYRFKSTEPYTSTAAGNVYLRVELTAFEHRDGVAAEAAFEELLAGADPDTGLTYAWYQVLLGGAVVYRLHAPCLFSEETSSAWPPSLRNSRARKLRGSSAAGAVAAAGRCLPQHPGQQVV